MPEFTGWLVGGLAALLAVVLVPQAWTAWARWGTARKHLEIERRELAARERMLLRQESEVESGWSGYRKFRVKRRVDEANDIVSLYLEPHDGLSLPLFAPGQHLTFRFQVPGQPKPLVRCYSLSNAPVDARYYRISVKRIRAYGAEDRDGIVSSHIHDQLEEGSTLDVRAPSGRFVMDEVSEQPVLMIAGGIGITPLLSMLDYLLNAGDERSIDLFYCVRDRSGAMMVEHLERLARVYRNFRLHLYLTDDADATAAHHERVSVAGIIRDLGVGDRYADCGDWQPLVYLCGPSEMMDSMRLQFADWGLPGSSLHYEAFGPSAVRSTGTTGLQPAVGVSYDVHFKRSQRTVSWTGEDGSLLDLAEANGIVLDSGCRVGECGTCLLALLQGKVEYPDRAPDVTLAAGTCLSCVGKPASDLVIDA